MPESSKLESEQFVDHIVLYLRALGLDFFTPPPTEVTSSELDDSDPISEVPINLRPVVGNLAAVLVKMPQATFYATKSPDVRAKVTVGQTFRVFARLKFRKNGIRVQLKDLNEDLFVPAEEQNAAGKLTGKLEAAHKIAVEKLQPLS